MQSMWPAEDVPQGGRCMYCGAERVPEVLVLSPMWHFMEEAATWYDGIAYTAPGRLDATVLSHSTWDWEIVLVFTCSESCQAGGESVCLAVEQVAAYNLASLPGTMCDPAAIERMNGAVAWDGDAGLGEAETVDTAAAAAAVEEEGMNEASAGAPQNKESQQEEASG